MNFIRIVYLFLYHHMAYIWQHTNQNIFVKELMKRWIEVHTIEPALELIQCTYKWHEELIVDRYSTLHAYPAYKVVSDKFLAKHFMQQHGVYVPKWAIFDSDRTGEIVEYIDSTLHYPVVLKPNRWSHGDNIFLHITSREECIKALEQFQQSQTPWVPCIIEELIEWNEYRVFITKEKKVACILREPAYITWNGTHTIQDLILLENSLRQARETYALYPIVPDIDYIQSQWVTMNTILDSWQRLSVRRNSNVATWWVTTDMTEEIHPHVIEICYKALTSFPGLAYTWIDFMTRDITQDPLEIWYAILEINSNPSFSIHELPRFWKPQNVSSIVADLLFPETKK